MVNCLADTLSCSIKVQAFSSEKLLSASDSDNSINNNLVLVPMSMFLADFCVFCKVTSTSAYSLVDLMKLMLSSYTLPFLQNLFIKLKRRSMVSM